MSQFEYETDALKCIHSRTWFQKMTSEDTMSMCVDTTWRTDAPKFVNVWTRVLTMCTVALTEYQTPNCTYKQSYALFEFMQIVQVP